MGYEVIMGERTIGTMNPQTGKVSYTDAGKEKIKEMIAGQATSKGGFVSTSVKVVYKWDRSRKANNDAVHKLWKNNPLVQNRIRQLNSLVFGRGFSYTYDEATKQTVDAFWRYNRFKLRLNPMITDSQLYGELFIGLFPLPNGMTEVAIYESNAVEIDFNPANVDKVNFYYISYKDEEKNTDVTLKMLPVYQYLNGMEFQGNAIGKMVRKVRTSLGVAKGLSGCDGAMIHLKFNNSSAELRGTSDFRQTFQVINDYMDFRSDRMAIHQMYGSPSFDITINSDDPNVIMTRIEELAGFTIGSNPVHNESETWKPLEFKNSADSAEYDEKAMRGLICAGFGMPEHLVFNQSIGDESADGTFALNKIAEDMQDTFGDALVDIHKFVIATANGDITKIDEGQIIFPEISTMSEKAKAETYVLKVGANICSRKTASLNTGHNWDIEEQQMLDEADTFGSLMGTQDGGGIMGGRFSSRMNNQDPNADNGSGDRKARAQAENISTQKFGSRKTND